MPLGCDAVVMVEVDAEDAFEASEEDELDRCTLLRGTNMRDVLSDSPSMVTLIEELVHPLREAGSVATQLIGQSRRSSNYPQTSAREISRKPLHLLLKRCGVLLAPTGHSTRL